MEKMKYNPPSPQLGDAAGEIGSSGGGDNFASADLAAAASDLESRLLRICEEHPASLVGPARHVVEELKTATRAGVTIPRLPEALGLVLASAAAVGPSASAPHVGGAALLLQAALAMSSDLAVVAVGTVAAAARGPACEVVAQRARGGCPEMTDLLTACWTAAPEWCAGGAEANADAAPLMHAALTAVDAPVAGADPAPRLRLAEALTEAGALFFFTERAWREDRGRGYSGALPGLSFLESCLDAGGDFMDRAAAVLAAVLEAAAVTTPDLFVYLVRRLEAG